MKLLGKMIRHFFKKIREREMFSYWAEEREENAIVVSLDVSVP
jgi:hypothetical protein